MAPRDPEGDAVEPLSGRPMPVCVGAGIAVWLLLSPLPFAGFTGCWLAGFLRRSVPLRDALAGALVGGVGISTAALMVAVTGQLPVPGLPADTFSLGTVLVDAFDRTALGTYLSIAYVSFFATVGALFGLLGGYYGSGGYGDDETAHERAIALGRSYRSPDREERVRSDAHDSSPPDDRPGDEKADRWE